MLFGQRETFSDLSQSLTDIKRPEFLGLESTFASCLSFMRSGIESLAVSYPACLSSGYESLRFLTNPQSNHTSAHEMVLLLAVFRVNS
jgi:hypothetical protein